MSSAKIIAKSTGFLFLTEVIDKIISFFLIVVITRYLGEIGFGKYSFAFAFISIFVTISTFGVVTYAFREIAKDKSKSRKLIDNIVTLRLTITICMFIVANIIAKYWPRAEEILVTILLVEVDFLFDSFNHTIREAVFNAYEKTGYRLYSITIEKSFSLVLGSFVLIRGYGLNGLLIALVFAKLITAIVNYIIMYKRFFKIALSIDFGLWLDLIKNSLPFGFAIIFRRIYYRIDSIMLSGMKGYAATGWYNAASTLIFALTFIPLVIINATFPAMSRFHYTNSKDILRLLYKKSLYYLILIGIPISIGITLLSQRIILFIYKESFVESSIVLQILSWSLLFLFVTQMMGYLLNSINKQHLFTISVGTCAISNVIMNFILIPKFSYIGASIATLITQFLNFCLVYYFTAKSGYPTDLIRISYKPVIAGILMGLLIVYIKFLPITYIIPIATIVYFMLLFLIKGVGKEEIELIKSFIQKNLN